MPRCASGVASIVSCPSQPWMCRSMRPGITNIPLALRVISPLPERRRRGTTSTIRPPSITSVPPRISEEGAKIVPSRISVRTSSPQRVIDRERALDAILSHPCAVKHEGGEEDLPASDTHTTGRDRGSCPFPVTYF